MLGDQYFKDGVVLKDEVSKAHERNDAQAFYVCLYC